MESYMPHLLLESDPLSAWKVIHCLLGKCLKAVGTRFFVITEMSKKYPKIQVACLLLLPNS